MLHMKVPMLFLNIVTVGFQWRRGNHGLLKIQAELLRVASFRTRKLTVVVVDFFTGLILRWWNGKGLLLTNLFLKRKCWSWKRRAWRLKSATYKNPKTIWLLIWTSQGWSVVLWLQNWKWRGKNNGNGFGKCVAVGFVLVICVLVWFCSTKWQCKHHVWLLVLWLLFVLFVLYPFVFAIFWNFSCICNIL